MISDTIIDITATATLILIVLFLSLSHDCQRSHVH